MSKKVLVIGKGGREHALAWKLAQSPKVSKVFVAPGNGGTLECAENVPIDVEDFHALARFAEAKKIDLTIVGPDNVLASGIVDHFWVYGLAIFGPTQNAAFIESSKSFAKDLMMNNQIPTAPFKTFFKYEDALEHVQLQRFPLVIKASGLALGKGAYVCRALVEAQEALHKIMVERVHGNSGNLVIVEEYLVGPEISIHALCDGNTFTLFPPTQDHKPLCDNNYGPNTGGMGTVTISWIVPSVMQNIGENIVQPTLSALAKGNREFSGLLFPGLKMTSEGPKVLEFNARFGDPETQSYMMLLKTDLYDLLEACVQGRLHKINLEWYPGFSATVVMASGGYPGVYKKGIPIYGLKKAESLLNTQVFHAGTVYEDRVFKTSGGRVLGVSAIGTTLQEALDCAYEGVRCIHFAGAHYRHDIGANALAHKFQPPPQ